MLAEGIKKAGTVDDAAGIAEVIRGLDFDTPIGHIAYDAQGDLRDPQIYIFQVRGGEFVQVYPE